MDMLRRHSVLLLGGGWHPCSPPSHCSSPPQGTRGCSLLALPSQSILVRLSLMDSYGAQSSPQRASSPKDFPLPPATCFICKLFRLRACSYLHNAIKSQLHPLVLGRTNCTCWSFYWCLNELGPLLPHDIPVSIFMEML